MRVFLVCFLLVSLVSFSQQQDVQSPQPKPLESFGEKLYFGGNLGAQFGSSTIFEASPLIGYHLTDDVSVGIGATYLYYSEQFLNYKFSTNVYGGRVFARYIVYEDFFVHGEDEILNIENFDFPGRRTTINNLLAGIGYRQSAGDNSSMVIMALWNFTDAKYSPYQNPIIRVGFNVGF